MGDGRRLMNTGTDSSARGVVRVSVCVLAGVCVLAAAARFVVYDILLTEQFMRIAAGALR